MPDLEDNEKNLVDLETAQSIDQDTRHMSREQIAFLVIKDGMYDSEAMQVFKKSPRYTFVFESMSFGYFVKWIVWCFAGLI